MNIFLNKDFICTMYNKTQWHPPKKKIVVNVFIKVIYYKMKFTRHVVHININVSRKLYCYMIDLHYTVYLRCSTFIMSECMNLCGVSDQASVSE